jgi:GAF domain-containing protein
MNALSYRGTLRIVVSMSMARSISNATLLRSNPETHVDPQSHLKQHEAVARLAQLALAGESMERLVYKTASLVASALDAEFVRVLEYDANEQILRLRAGVGWREPLIGSAVIKVSEDPQAGFALNARSYVIVDDIRLDARSCRCNLLLEHEVVSGVSVPIALDGKAVGVLSAHSRLPGRFTTQDASFLRSMAEVLSAAMSRSKADCALRESEALFKGVFNSDLVGIIFWTSDGAITEANDAFLKMTGYDRCDLREGKITWPGLSPSQG